MSALDNDIFTDFLYGDPVILARLEGIPPSEQFLPIVVVEETLRGRLNGIRQAEMGKGKISLALAFELFERSLRAIRSFAILSYTDAAHAEYLRLKALKLRVGTRDLRIASIAVAHDAKLISRNRRDFELVPGLKLELWN